MAVAYGNASSLATNSAANSVTVTKPTSTASGDVLLALVLYDGTFGTQTVSCTGWTVAEHFYDSGNDTGVALLYRIAGGSEGTNYTFSWTDAADSPVGQIYRFTGQTGGSTGGNPFKTSAGVGYAHNNTNSTIPSVSYDAEATGLGVWIHVGLTGGNTVTNPSGYTEHLDENTSPHRVVATRADTAGTGKTTGTGSSGVTASNWAFGGCIIDAFAQSVNVGLLTETDTSQTTGRLKSLAVGLVTETDTAQAVTKIDPIWVTVGLPTTTDTAQAFTSSKAWSIAVNLLTETDTAQVITAQVVHKRDVGQVTGTDTVFTIAVTDPIWVYPGLATETDTAQVLGRNKAVAIGLGW